jgi:hypothetical protein
MNPKSSIRNLIMSFLPGLVLGVVCGGLLGAFFTPLAEAWSAQNADPSAQSVLLASQGKNAR